MRNRISLVNCRKPWRINTLKLLNLREDVGIWTKNCLSRRLKEIWIRLKFRRKKDKATLLLLLVSNWWNKKKELRNWNLNWQRLKNGLKRSSQTMSFFENNSSSLNNQFQHPQIQSQYQQWRSPTWLGSLLPKLN